MSALYHDHDVHPVREVEDFARVRTELSVSSYVIFQCS